MRPITPKVIRNLLKPPERFAGGRLLNRLGYHALRVASFTSAYALRRPIVPKDGAAREAAETLIRDGIVVLPDFFPRETFDAIRRETGSLTLDVFNERAPRILRSAFVAEGRASASALLETHLAKNAFIEEVVSAALKKRVDVVPTVQVERSWFAPEDLGAESTDKADNLHFDVSYPTVKCFLYLTDTDAENAAFSYVRGSHRMTWPRLRMEHAMGLDFWTWDAERRATVTPEVPAAFLEENGLKLESVDGKAGTLIIVNTMGFHRRGDYRGPRPRELVIVNYRAMDGLKRSLRGALQVLRRRNFS